MALSTTPLIQLAGFSLASCWNCSVPSGPVDGTHIFFLPRKRCQRQSAHQNFRYLASRFFDWVFEFQLWKPSEVTIRGVKGCAVLYRNGGNMRIRDQRPGRLSAGYGLLKYRPVMAAWIYNHRLRPFKPFRNDYCRLGHGERARKHSPACAQTKKSEYDDPGKRHWFVSR